MGVLLGYHSVFTVSFLLDTYFQKLLNIRAISSYDSIHQQAFLFLPDSIWSPLLAVLSFLCPHLTFLYLDLSSWSWAGRGFFCFFSSCPGNTSRPLGVPEQRTGKNCCTQHTKHGQWSYPVALPSSRATRKRPTPQKNNFDSSFISPLSLKLYQPTSSKTRKSYFPGKLQTVAQKNRHTECMALSRRQKDVCCFAAGLSTWPALVYPAVPVCLPSSCSLVGLTTEAGEPLPMACSPLLSRHSSIAPVLAEQTAVGPNIDKECKTS